MAVAEYPSTFGTVTGQISRLNLLADRLIAQTQYAVQNLQGLSFANQDLDPRLQWGTGDLEALQGQLGSVDSPDLNGDWLAGLSLGAGDENFAFDPSILSRLGGSLADPSLPSLPSAPSFPAPPADPGEPGELAAPTKPSLPEYALDADAVNVGGAMPELEDFTSGVPFPTMREITIPPVPVLAEIEFDATRPVFAGTVPDSADFGFEGGSYNPMLLERIKTEIIAVLDGGKGMPPAIERAIFERAREDEVELAERSVDQVRDEYAAKGYKYPPGGVAARVDRFRIEAGKKVSALNREKMIETYKLQIDLFKTALGSAIQLEEVWIGQFTASERLRFEAASLKLNFAMQIFSAYVQRFNAEASMFQVEASVYHERIQAEIAKLSVYTAQIEGQKLISDINAQDVQLYGEKIKALVVNAEIYKARVEGYTAKFEAVKARVEIYKAQLESNKTLADMYDTETKAFATLTQAQQSRDQRFEIKANIYAKTVEARSKEAEIALSYFETSFKTAELQRDTFLANVEQVKSLIGAESARVQALASKYQAMSSEIGAKAEVEKSKYALMLAVAQARVARMQAAAEILTKNAEITIQSVISAEGLMLKARETATTTLAQLAAGFTSAANVNASISESSSTSYSFSESVELDSSSHL